MSDKPDKVRKISDTTTFIEVHELASRLGVSLNGVTRLLKRLRIPTILLARGRYVHQGVLDAALLVSCFIGGPGTESLPADFPNKDHVTRALRTLCIIERVVRARRGIRDNILRGLVQKSTKELLAQ